MVIFTDFPNANIRVIFDISKKNFWNVIWTAFHANLG